MIQPKKRIEQSSFGNITDYSQTDKCHKGYKSFFVFVRFDDDSEILWSNIFAASRQIANLLVLEKFFRLPPLHYQL